MPHLEQARFVDEYLVDLNATQAAIRAGYSPKRADAIGHENLRKPEIAAAIEERMKAREKRTEITQDRVLTELARGRGALDGTVIALRYSCRSETTQQRRGIVPTLAQEIPDVEVLLGLAPEELAGTLLKIIRDNYGDRSFQADSFTSVVAGTVLRDDLAPMYQRRITYVGKYTDEVMRRLNDSPLSRTGETRRAMWERGVASPGVLLTI